MRRPSTTTSSTRPSPSASNVGIPGAGVEDLRAQQPAHGGARVRRCQDDRALARGHAVALAVRAHGAGEHHTGEVVAGEGEEALVRTGRDDDLACTHVPQPRAPLVEHDEAVVVVADRRRPGQHPQFVERLDVRRVARAGQDHAGAGPRRGLGGRPPGGAGPGDEHVAVGVHPVVAAWVSRAVERPAHRQRGRDEPLAQPDARRLHHRLAVGADERAGLLGAGGHDPARRGRGGSTARRRPRPSASSAEARVSPAKPVRATPSNVKRSGRERSIALPPSGRRRPLTRRPG